MWGRWTKSKVRIRGSLYEYSDNELWGVLDYAHLKSYVESLPTGLEYECGEGGQNLR